MPRRPVNESVSFRKRNAMSAAIAGAADIMSELIRALLYSYDLKRNVSPNTNPTNPLKAKNSTCTKEILYGMPQTIIVKKRRITAATSRATFTYTDPMRVVAAANASALPVHITAVTRALNSPAYGMRSTMYSKGI
jgi:hypothetical protein